MEGLYLVVEAFIVIQTVTSGIMCVYGYKWGRALIATASSYVGVAIGLVICIMLFESGFGVESFIAIPTCAAAFSAMAYKNITLNHFMAGFLLATKISFMIITKVFEYGMSDDIGGLLVLPIIIGIIGGIVSCTKFTGYIVLACLAFWGSIDFVPKMFEWINGTLFAMTGDYSFIFDPISFLLSLFGIEIPSGGEVFFILLLTVGGFYFQKNRAESAGKDLSRKLVDDRNLFE